MFCLIATIIVFNECISLGQLKTLTLHLFSVVRAVFTDSGKNDPPQIFLKFNKDFRESKLVFAVVDEQ